MCDYSLQSVRSRPARIADKLTTRDFGTGTIGFASAHDHATALCILPGTELRFERPVKLIEDFETGAVRTTDYTTAIFRQYNKHKVNVHHDALEFPDGSNVLLTLLAPGQSSAILQLPAPPKNAVEKQEQKRAAYV